METAIQEYDVAEAIALKQLEIKKLTEQVTELKSYFRQGETRVLEREGRPTLEVKVTPNSRIDDGLALRSLTPETYLSVSKRSIDTTKARKVLTTGELARITKTYEPKIEVKLV